MTTIPPSPHHLHRPRPPPSSSSQAKSAPPSGLAIATAVVRRLVREQSSYVVELTGQEARLAELSQRKKGGDEDEDENWDYRVKQEVIYLLLLFFSSNFLLTCLLGEGRARERGGGGCFGQEKVVLWD